MIALCTQGSLTIGMCNVRTPRGAHRYILSMSLATTAMYVMVILCLALDGASTQITIDDVMSAVVKLKKASFRPSKSLLTADEVGLCLMMSTEVRLDQELNTCAS